MTEVATEASKQSPVKPVPRKKAARADLAPYIDHTLLKADTTPAEVAAVCEEALDYGFASVCVASSNVPLVAAALGNSGVKTCCVIGFPHGDASTAAKAAEAAQAVSDGAGELDVVVHRGALKNRDYKTVVEDLQAVVRAAGDVPVKVILETAALEPEAIAIACVLCKAAGAAFVKTATGFGPGGASVEAIALMRATVGEELGVKASGGVRDAATADAMIAAGASRIGASSSIAIVTGGAGSSGY